MRWQCGDAASNGWHCGDSDGRLGSDNATTPVMDGAAATAMDRNIEVVAMTVMDGTTAMAIMQ